MKPIVTLRSFVLLLVICLLIAAGTVIFIISRYDKEEPTVNIITGVEIERPAALPLPVKVSGPADDKVKSSPADDDQAEHEGRLKPNEPLLQ